MTASKSRSSAFRIVNPPRGLWLAALAGFALAALLSLALAAPSAALAQAAPPAPAAAPAIDGGASTGRIRAMQSAIDQVMAGQDKLF